MRESCKKFEALLWRKEPSVLGSLRPINARADWRPGKLRIGGTTKEDCACWGFIALVGDRLVGLITHLVSHPHCQLPLVYPLIYPLILPIVLLLTPLLPPIVSLSISVLHTISYTQMTLLKWNHFIIPTNTFKNQIVTVRSNCKGSRGLYVHSYK